MQAAMCLKIFLEMPKDSFSLQKKKWCSSYLWFRLDSICLPKWLFPLEIPTKSLQKIENWR